MRIFTTKDYAGRAIHAATRPLKSLKRATPHPQLDIEGQSDTNKIHLSYMDNTLSTFVGNSGIQIEV